MYTLRELRHRNVACWSLWTVFSCSLRSSPGFVSNFTLLRTFNLIVHQKHSQYICTLININPDLCLHTRSWNMSRPKLCTMWLHRKASIDAKLNMTCRLCNVCQIGIIWSAVQAADWYTSGLPKRLYGQKYRKVCKVRNSEDCKNLLKIKNETVWNGPWDYAQEKITFENAHSNLHLYFLYLYDVQFSQCCTCVTCWDFMFGCKDPHPVHLSVPRGCMVILTSCEDEIGKPLQRALQQI